MGQTIATNKKAYRDFFFSQTWECGIVLNGAEVKSIRAGHVNFKDSFARLEGEELFLYSLHIEPYFQAALTKEEPDRKRKLLLHKKEIKKADGLMMQKHLALIPTKLYFNNRGFVKVELALGKGKKVFDKREDIKKRDIDRDIRRVVRGKR